MDKVVLTAEQANELLKYLASKPFSEVAGLIQMIQKSVVKELPKPEKE